ncbi:hypothetical protein [Longimicrobium terrae]|uniref:Uncharacterized protein n=1 Tax=Longimicrobium terrae TaxID=1639882 RepID=A0A841GZC7_9BACT|nr:hypothetical protein [Longimicrobium terrae]MBB4636889.1 hypothetical protein [Longimicrobium terrae]MBB6071112.1 hypothetical protein [Longimicrobium terrae]NNC29161.1 hypothetical protein [Longimicrobium terrae]
MSNVGPEGRSFHQITQADLQRLAQIAADDLSDFFDRHPEWAGQYQNRVLGTALCQGAASHYLHGEAGINDFDVYTFFARNPVRDWYAKRNKTADFGVPKFGTSVDQPGFLGRRVDLLGRSLDVSVGTDVGLAIRRWLQAGRTKSAQLLAAKAVVLLSPADRLGEVVWPAPLDAVSATL